MKQQSRPACLMHAGGLKNKNMIKPAATAFSPYNCLSGDFSAIERNKRPSRQVNKIETIGALTAIEKVVYWVDLPVQEV